jgi:hypothetical protein
MKANNIIAIKILDLLEQIEAVNRLLAMYAKEENDGIIASMIRQHSSHKQEFVDELNTIFNKYALTINALETPAVSKAKKLYKNETLAVAAVAEDIVAYKKGE